MTGDSRVGLTRFDRSALLLASIGIAYVVCGLIGANAFVWGWSNGQIFHFYYATFAVVFGGLSVIALTWNGGDVNFGRGLILGAALGYLAGVVSIFLSTLALSNGQERFAAGFNSLHGLMDRIYTATIFAAIMLGWMIGALVWCVFILFQRHKYKTLGLLVIGAIVIAVLNLVAWSTPILPRF